MIVNNIKKTLKKNTVIKTCINVRNKILIKKAHNLSRQFIRANELSKFKQQKKGKRCFIIGNGPSLTLEDLNLLKNEENNRFSLRCFPHFSVLLVYSFLPLTFPVSSATTITAPANIVYRNPNEIFRLFSKLPFQQTYATISIRKQTSSCLQPYLFNPISFSEPVSGNFFRQ